MKDHVDLLRDTILFLAFPGPVQVLPPDAVCCSMNRMITVVLFLQSCLRAKDRNDLMRAVSRFELRALRMQDANCRGVERMDWE